MEQKPSSKPTTLEQRQSLMESGELQREVLKQLISPETIERIGALVKSPVVQQIAAFQAAMVTSANTFIQKPEVQAFFRTVTQSIGTFASSPQMGDAIRGISELSRAMEQLADSPLAAFLASGGSPDISRLVEGAGVATASINATGDARVIRGDQLEIERQIVGHLESGNAVETLSGEQKLRLRIIMTLLTALFAYLAAQNGARQELCFLQPKLLPTMSMNQIGKSVRNAMCEAQVPLELLSEFRSVKGEGVHLRTAPRMKSPLVQVGLPDRATLHVLDDSNRDWLLVSVVGEDGVEGWISRKYTHKLR
jgi:hypothetical protein